MNALEVNQPQVVFETFEGDTVLIHLDTGRYFNLGGSASLVWQWLLEGCAVSEMERALQSRFGTTDGLQAFLDHLLAEQLVRPVSASGATPSEVAAEVAYEAPFLNVTSDLEELFTIDPIHDVDDSGWPNLKAAEVP